MKARQGGVGTWHGLLTSSGWQLERFQAKWIPVRRFENATTQEFGAFVLILSERKML
jgi:hypothetical protein